MSNPGDYFYGWDLLYKTIEKDINKKDDLLIALAHFPRPFAFPEVGRGDLDLLGHGGHGNLFPFPSHPEFRVGPGSSGGMQPRFDPYGPQPERNLRPNPNPDHLQPPNFGGDYFIKLQYYNNLKEQT
uniref:Uncharacterized protein n=1 Tax=Glossina morsitans morsitans TaxID=37546 RepID=A0A1B0FC65_GLOMM